MLLRELFESSELFYCESCDNVFPSHTVKLVSVEAHIKELYFHKPFTFVDDEDVVWFESGGVGVLMGDKVMACPLCNKIQPKGFNKLFEVKV